MEFRHEELRDRSKDAKGQVTIEGVDDSPPRDYVKEARQKEIEEQERKIARLKAEQERADAEAAKEGERSSNKPVAGCKVDPVRMEFASYRDWPWWKFWITCRGTVLCPILPWILIYFLVSVLVYAAEHQESDSQFWENMSYVPHFMFLIPFSLLLILRVGFALYKSWEARSATNKLYHYMQEVIRIAHLYIEREDKEDQVALHHILRYLPVFAIVTKNNVVPNFYGQGRGGYQVLRSELSPHLSRDEVDTLVEGCTSNRPLLVATWISRWMVGVFRRGKLLGGKEMLCHFNEIIQQMLEGWIQMNKVSSTPCIFAVVHFLFWVMVIWCLTLPLCLASTCGGYTIVAVPMIGALLHGMERLGYELEEPFGSSPNCLPTDKLVGATYFDIKLLFWGCDVKLAPLDRDSAQDDVIGKMEKAFTMGLETIALDFDNNTTPKHSNAEKVPAIAEGNTTLSSKGPDGISLGARIRSKGQDGTPRGEPNPGED